MKRIRLKSLTCLFFLLSAAIAAIWFRSFQLQPSPATYADRFFLHQFAFYNARGHFQIVYVDPDHGPDKPFDYRDWHALGFEFGRWQASDWQAGSQYTDLTIPYWAPFTFAAILTTYTLWCLLKHQSNTLNSLCPTCFYDLRAHHAGAAGDKCPECGTPIPNHHHV